MYSVGFEDRKLSAGKSSQTLPPLNKKSSSSEYYANSILPKRTVESTDELQIGVLDSWPAHSANQRPSNVQISLNRNNELRITNELEEGKPELVPKPKFLEKLEKFLNRELKMLDTYAAKPCEARLQAYREVFEYLLEEFKTYRPILSAIKNEYEIMLTIQKEKIRELEPLKQMLVTLSDQCDQKLMEYREQEKIELKTLKDEKRALQEMIFSLQNDKQTLKVQLDKLQNELISQHEKYRNEYDKRKLLIADINDLRFQQEELRLAEQKREKKGGGHDENSEEMNGNDDPITLKIALRVCRKNLNDAMKRLTKMEADYGEVVPRRDYLALETVYNELKEKSDTLEGDYSTLRNDYTTLKEYTKNLESKAQEMQEELEMTRQNNTPRPDWERCNALIDGGTAGAEEKWRDLMANKSSIEILDTLINELDGTNKKDFVGLGTGHDVPIYLRHEGKIKNLNLSRKEICKVITTFLNDRMQLKKDQGEEASDIKAYFIENLKKKHPNEAYEYSYCIHDAFSKYSNEFIMFFESVLKGEVDEQIYYQERKCISMVIDQLKEIDSRDQSNGIIAKNLFRDVIKPLFKHKSNEEISNLVKTAEEDSELQDSSKIDYKSIFSEESEDSISNFLIMFKSYLKDERIALANILKESLERYGIITPVDLRKAINSADNSISDRSIDKIVSWCFKNEKQIDQNKFRERIENACLYNYPRK